MRAVGSRQNACPGPDPGWIPVFSPDRRKNKRLERDDLKWNQCRACLPLPGNKGVARRAVPVRPRHAGGVLAARRAGTPRRLGNEHLREVRHHKAPKPGAAVPTRRTGTALCHGKSGQGRNAQITLNWFRQKSSRSRMGNCHASDLARNFILNSIAGARPPRPSPRRGILVSINTYPVAIARIVVAIARIAEAIAACRSATNPVRAATRAGVKCPSASRMFTVPSTWPLSVTGMLSVA